jgi:nucleoredoxin
VLLKKLYARLKSSERSSFEFIFISSDRNESDFMEYFENHQPWLALPYEKREEKAELSKLFGVRVLPSFVIVDGRGNVICKVCV